MACITKRRGRWVIDFYDQTGVRRWKTLKEDVTKKEAKEELRAIEDDVSKGLYLPNKKVPLFAKVAQDWLEYKKPNVRSTTWDTFDGHIRNHFDMLNSMKINLISVSIIEKFIRQKQDSNMNLKTLRKILVTLNQIFSYAVRHRFIDHNPLRDAERPKSHGSEGEHEQDKINILTPDQIPIFLSKSQDPKYNTLFTLAVFTGMREGEILGLKWGDMDWENKQVHVQRTYTKGKFFTTKTKASNRKIDIGPKVLTKLKRWKLACPRNELDLMFPNESGNPMNYSNMVKRHFLPALKEAEISAIRFHDLRHTFASLLIEQGENIKYIQTQLGHSSPTVTWNVYTHLMKPTNQEAACRLENTIFNETGSKMVAEAGVVI